MTEILVRIGKMKTAILAAVVIALSGCGAGDRLSALVTGDGVEICHKGVVYLQFTSGVTVMYARDGKIALCEKFK